VLLATIAAGSLIGSFVAEPITRMLGRARALALTIVTAVLLVGIPAVTTNPFVIGAAYLVGGSGVVIWNVIVVSLRQRITPNQLLGRVNSGYRLIAWGTMPLGAAIGGLLAQLLGLRAVFATMAVVTLALFAGMTTVTNENMAKAEHDTT
jgi:MFS family permease